jgi:hypothetical protein
MSDMGVPFGMEKATAGEESPHDPKVNMEEAHKAQEASSGRWVTFAAVWRHVRACMYSIILVLGACGTVHAVSGP